MKVKTTIKAGFEAVPLGDLWRPSRTAVGGDPASLQQNE